MALFYTLIFTALHLHCSQVCSDIEGYNYDEHWVPRFSQFSQKLTMILQIFTTIFLQP